MHQVPLLAFTSSPGKDACIPLRQLLLPLAGHSDEFLVLRNREVNETKLRRGTIQDTVIRKDFPPLMNRLLMIRDAILEAEGTVDGATTCISARTSGSTFRTADAYTFSAHHGQKLSWTKIVWNVTFSPKFSFILWLAVLERLPTLDRLTFLDIDRTCKLYNQQEQSLSNLFFTCSFTDDIWKSIKEWAGLRRRRMATIRNCLLRLKWDCRGTSWICNFRKLSFAATLYYIWECRNKVAFEQYSINRNHIISKIKIQD
ncbi:hypothetical protein M9H77_17995 [Catharanthus roseus]|uniref:Uncharacterized protein n=1 Tax=Catharanthus roseus TaxID=4058 RepID=A0ACC0B681_CATRO|nr:hypothetical protein M9H77_17995 [Catharanthus roseus]